MTEIQPRFLIKEKGKKVAVQLDIVAYRALLELTEDTALGREMEKSLREDSERIPIAEAKRSYCLVLS